MIGRHRALIAAPVEQPRRGLPGKVRLPGCLLNVVEGWKGRRLRQGRAHAPDDQPLGQR